MILVADQWDAVEDRELECCRSVKAELRTCLGQAALKLTICGMTMTPAAWRCVKLRECHPSDMMCYGGLSDSEFRAWMDHQDIALLKTNETELESLTGKTPLLLSVFPRVYHSKIVAGKSWTWEALVENVVEDVVVTDMKGALGSFYEHHDAATLWKVFLCVSSSSNSPYVDRRFFYQPRSDGYYWKAIGDIALRLLFQVWQTRLASEHAGFNKIRRAYWDKVIDVLQDRAFYTSSPAFCRFLDLELARALDALPGRIALRDDN